MPEITKCNLYKIYGKLPKHQNVQELGSAHGTSNHDAIDNFFELLTGKLSKQEKKLYLHSKKNSVHILKAFHDPDKIHPVYTYKSVYSCIIPDSTIFTTDDTTNMTTNPLQEKLNQIKQTLESKNEQ